MMKGRHHNVSSLLAGGVSWSPGAVEVVLGMWEIEQGFVAGECLRRKWD